VIDLGEAEAILRERGTGQVFFLHTGEWRLYYDLSLDHYVMKVWLNAQVEPAAQVVTGSGTYALPERLWKASCTFRGPEKAQPIEAWRADGGALLRRSSPRRSSAAGGRPRTCSPRSSGRRGAGCVRLRRPAEGARPR